RNAWPTSCGSSARKCARRDSGGDLADAVSSSLKRSAGRRAGADSCGRVRAELAEDAAQGVGQDFGLLVGEVTSEVALDAAQVHGCRSAQAGASRGRDDGVQSPAVAWAPLAGDEAVRLHAVDEAG